jgi:hypothetical protein
MSDVHLAFVGFWLIAALLAWAWNAPVARHLVSLAAVTWWVLCAIGVEEARAGNAAFAFSAGSALLFGAGLALASRASETLRAFGLTLSNYGAIAMAVGLALAVASAFGFANRGLPNWTIACGGAGLALAFFGCTADRRAGPILAALSIALALLVVSGWVSPSTVTDDEPWVVYALALASMLCLVVSGMLDDVRPRVVAGWIGLAAVIAAITWAVKGSLLRRAAFLAAAGIVAVGLASVLGRLVRKERPR